MGSYITKDCVALVSTMFIVNGFFVVVFNVCTHTKGNIRKIVGIWHLKWIFTSSHFNLYHYSNAFYYAHDVIKIDFMYIHVT